MKKHGEHTRRFHFRNFLNEIKWLLAQAVGAKKSNPALAAVLRERAEMNRAGINKARLTPMQRKLADIEYNKVQAAYIAKKKLNRKLKETDNA